MKDLPKYKITIDENYSDGEKLGIEKIAHTARPAIKIKGVAFNDAELHPNCRCKIVDGELKTEPDACEYCLEMKNKEFSFSLVKSYGFKDDIKMRIAAPLMVPGEIYRNDDEDGEHYVEFTVEEIEKIHKDFMKNLTNKSIYNEEHDNTRISDKSYLLEALLIDSDSKIKMVKEDYGIELPKGSLFTITQIEDKEYFDYLVENDMLGLSLEGFLGLKLSEIKNKKENMNENVNLELLERIKELELRLQKFETIEKEELEEKEEIIEEIVEEIVKEEEIVEEKEEEKVELTEDEVMKYVQPKIDEILEMIAEIKAGISPKVEEEEKKEFKFSEVDNRVRKALRLNEILKK
jgi:hypothetical protein